MSKADAEKGLESKERASELVRELAQRGLWSGLSIIQVIADGTDGRSWSARSQWDALVEACCLHASWWPRAFSPAILDRKYYRKVEHAIQ